MYLGLFLICSIITIIHKWYTKDKDLLWIVQKGLNYITNSQTNNYNYSNDDDNDNDNDNDNENENENGMETTAKRIRFGQFQRSWLIVYLLVMCADWLQGPYVYPLYIERGFDVGQIAILFIAGFGSSAVFGSFVGGLCDIYGRRLGCLVFCISYGLTCLTKFSSSYSILMIGRLLSGISTSLLFSVFEAWMVSEHNSRGFSPNLLQSTFSLATLTNGIIAIVAGIVAGILVKFFGVISPFIASFILLLIACYIVFINWSENYGDPNINIQNSFKNAFIVLKSDKNVLNLGLLQSLFEGSMYSFVFMYVPMLQAIDSQAPIGMIFANFMVMIMLGSGIFKSLIKTYSTSELLKMVFLIASISLLIPMLFPNSVFLLMISFLIFELCVGIYFPTIGTLRGKIIPESSRSGIMNIFRIGLNLLVIIILLLVKVVSFRVIFGFCSLWLGLGWYYQTPNSKKLKAEGNLPF